MQKYLFVIIIYLFSLAILALVMKQFFGKIIDRMMDCSKTIAKYFAKYIKSKRSIFIVELTFFLITLLAASVSFIVNNSLKIITMIFYIFTIFILAELISILKGRDESYSSLIDKLFGIYEKYKNLYIINRIVLMLKQVYSLYFMFVVLSVIFEITVIRDLPIDIYFYLFVTLPIIANIWIYFIYGKQKRNSLDVDMRRLICYFLLFIILFVDVRAKFFDYVDDGKISTTSYTLLVSINSVLFLGIDRFLKIITDDYDRFYSKGVPSVTHSGYAEKDMK